LDHNSSNSERENPTVLICEGDRDLRLALCALLSREGYLPVGAADVREAVSRSIGVPPVCVVLSLPLPGGESAEVLHGLRGLGGMAEVGVVLIAPRELLEREPAGFHRERDVHLPPSYRPDDLLAAVKAVSMEMA
jgi:DNA-binding response OmpR family regulator